MAISAPSAKSRLVPMLLERGAVFENCIHPAAAMGRHNTVGNGLVIYGNFGMSVNCVLGNYLSLIGPGFGHDIKVGDYTTISAYVHVMGNVTIGREVFIGANAAIAPGVNVGDGAYICMGSMVMKDVPAGAKVMGNPAREIG